MILDGATFGKSGWAQARRLKACWSELTRGLAVKTARRRFLIAVATKNCYNERMTLQQIDSLCDEFEAALRRGEAIRIEDILPQVEEPQRSDLLEELLEIEIQFAVESNASEDFIGGMLESLKNRFPDKHDFIQSLFRQIVPLRRIGDYDIIDELGRGGMGIVYKAKHKLLQQTVAIKVLSQTLIDDSQAVGRFKREMQLIGGLDHPNVVRALNAGEIGGTLYLAMEFVDGISLQKLVESVRTKNENLPAIPLGAACEAIRQAALGLQNAHELRLVHRDIKPANLMLDRRGTVKILDLGLGKFADERREDYHSSLTMAGMVIGTVDYISPEQCENSKEADIRSDLYSLGCSLYFLLTGKPVYSGSRYDTIRKKLMAHIVGDVPSLRQAIPNFPSALESILQKVLAKAPAERFQTPLEFAEALLPFASYDELWTLMGEVLPASDSTARSDSRYASSPYGMTHSSRQNMTVRPASRWKWIAFFVAMNLLMVGLILGPTFRLHTWKQADSIDVLQREAQQARDNANQHWEQWRMGEAQAEYQKVTRMWQEYPAQTNDIKEYLRVFVSWYRLRAALTQWYLGDSARVRQDLQFQLNRIDDNVSQDEETRRALLQHKVFILEHLGDFVLFGGAASERNRERFTNAISRYDESARLTDDHRYRLCRWKQAILLSMNGDIEQAETLLKQYPMPDETVVGTLEPDFRLIHQLAEAVLFYYQQGESADRDQKLRAFQRQFRPPGNVPSQTAAQPEIMDLRLFCGEFLIHDSIKREDWKTLAEDILEIRNGTGTFLRQYPGATPFMRRFNELLVRATVLLYDQADLPRDKQRHLDSIVRLLERMRLPAGVDGERDPPTLIYFFLPESNRPEEGFVICFPPDGRAGTFYPLLLTRQMVKQGAAVPPLDERLLEQIKGETRIRVSWDDSASWSRGEEAMTETNYPYGDVLPLRR